MFGANIKYMSFIEGVQEWWEEQDEIDRKRIYIGIAFFFLIIYLIYTLNYSYNSLGDIASKGIGQAGDKLSEVKNITNKLT